LYGVPLVIGTPYHAFGDSITVGSGANTNANAYAYLLSSDEDSPLTDRGINGEQACDMGDLEVFPNENPATTYNALYTMMIGTNDANVKGLGSYEAVFNTCEQAAVAWLAIPSQYKVFGQSASTTETGTWSSDNTYQTGIGIQSTANGSTLAIPITTTGAPVYIWYRIKDGNGGAFTYNIDGGANISVNAFTSPAIATQNGGTEGVALARIPNVAAGAHTINFTVTSATSVSNFVSILAVGTVPNIVYYQSPKVFVGGVLRQQNDTDSAATAAYNADVSTNVSLLAGDGLSVYFVNDRNYVNSTTDMANFLHPNNTGHRHLADAFEAVMQFVPSPAYSNSNNFTLALGSLGAAGWMGATTSPFYSVAIGYGSLNSTPVNAGVQKQHRRWL
jgi:hypothetical protein